MENLAEKCINDHKNPIVRVTLPSQKLFLAAKDDAENELIKEYQDNFETILRHLRVEKRCGRAQAVWLHDQRIAKVSKVVKNLLKYFGYQNKEGVYLYPEEMLFLLETNRLEVHLNGASLSVEEAYEIVLRIPDYNLTKYRVYKKLATLGYKLLSYEQLQIKKLKSCKKNENKRKRECDESHKNKKTTEKLLPENEIDYLNSQKHALSNDKTIASTLIPKELQYISNIFQQLKSKMPRDCSPQMDNCANPDFCVFLSANISKNQPDFNVFICKENVMEKSSFSSDLPNIYAICFDDVSFYKLANVHLPFI